MFTMRRFKKDQSGSTATLFALTLVPMVGFVGGALDYNRAANVQTSMQRAADASAMALVRMPAYTTDSQVAQRAQAVFDTAYGFGGALPRPSSVTATRNGKTYTVAAKGSVQNTFMQLLGQPATPVAVSSTVSAGTQRIELALVLDNTGSMNDRIGGERKIDALKVQAKKLLKTLNAAATDANSVKVSVVPFDTEIRLDADTYRYKSWYRGLDNAADRQKWSGYVFDRYNGYAASDAAPSAAVKDSLFPAPINSEYKSMGLGDLAKVQPLTSIYSQGNLNTLTNLVDTMQPRGNTNLALGLNWGLATLSPGEPFTEASPSADNNVKRIMILLTDGLNTEYHLNGQPQVDQSSAGAAAQRMNANTTTTCNLIKGHNVEVFTIRLLDGDANLLKNCASPDVSAKLHHYSDVQTATDLSKTFDEIKDAILEPRFTS